MKEINFEQKKEKKIYKYISFIGIFAIVFSLIAMNTSSITTGVYDSGIWQIINADTITQISPKLNVQIGENISTLEKFRVTGSSEFNGTVGINNGFTFSSNGWASFNGPSTTFYNIIFLEDHSLLTSQGNVDFDDDATSQRFKVDFENTYFNDNVVFNDTVTFNNNVDFKGEITYNGYDVSLLPKYSIQMYGGLSSDFNSYGYFLNDTHWHLCNGLNNTINLTDRFIVCAGNVYSQNETGGNNSILIVDANLPVFVKTCVPSTSAYFAPPGVVTLVNRVTVTSGGSAFNTPIDNRPVYKGLYYIEFMGYP